MSSSIKGAAEEISMDTGVAAVLSELDDIFTLNVNKRCFVFTLDLLWQEFS